MTETSHFGDAKRREAVFSLLCLLVLMIFVAMFEQKGIEGANSAIQHLVGRSRVAAGIDVSWIGALAFLTLGVAVGLLGGMLGMGGGVLKVACLLLLFKFDIFFSRAVSIATMFIMALSATWQHFRRGLTLPEVVRPMILPAVGGVLGGVLLGNVLRGSTLTSLFGFFMLFLAFNTLAQVFADPDEYSLREAFQKKREQHRGYLCGSIGGLHGFLCGLLGISGGVVTTPMQQILLQVPVRNAIANSLLVSTLCTGAGSVVVVWTGLSRGDFALSQFVPVALCIGVGAAAGAQIGVRLSGRASSAVLRVLFVLVASACGLSILL